MSDPRRLLEDLTGLTDDERRALVAAARIHPPPSAAGAVWAGLLSRLPPSSGSGHGDGSGGGKPGTPSDSPAGAGTNGGPTLGKLGAGATSAAGMATVGAFTTGALVKSFIAGAALGLALGVAGQGVLHTIADRRAPSDRAPTANEPGGAAQPASPRGTGQAESDVTLPAEPRPVSEPPTPARSSTSDRAEASHTPHGDPTALVASPEPSGAQTSQHQASFDSLSTSRLTEESQWVAAARAHLVRGNPAAALSTLELAQRRHPQGVMLQEREALAIQALAMLGQTPLATARARTFLEQNPDSPHADRVRSVLGRGAAPPPAVTSAQALMDRRPVPSRRG